MRTVRRRLRDISRQKGKAIRLAMRVADTPELSLDNGVDAASWIEEGLVDLLVAGAGYVPFTTPVETWINLGHAAGIPVYPCLSGSTRAFQDIRAARAAAQRFWSAGADGLYWFNLFVMSGIRGGRRAPEVHDPHQQQIAEETGEAAVLSGLDKLYTVDRTQEAGYIAHICPRAPLPVTFSTASGSQEKRIPIPVGDDLKESAAGSTLKRNCALAGRRRSHRIRRPLSSTGFGLPLVTVFEGRAPTAKPGWIGSCPAGGSIGEPTS